MVSDIKFEFFMSQFKHIRDIKETEKTKISIVFYEPVRNSCILRICKGRDLSLICTALKKIRNINIATVYDFIYANGNTYIIEENISGKTLDEALEEKGTFTEEETAKIIICICNGLKSLHGLPVPIVHNDINVSNIMMCDDNNVKLFDFDISRMYITGKERNTTLFGTEEYASPEHFGYGQSQPRTDIYCLGVTMHKMLSGQTLLPDHHMVYNGKLKKIIEKCIRVNVSERYSSVDTLSKALGKFLKRGKIKLIYAAVSFLILAALIFGILSFHNQDKAEMSGYGTPSGYKQENTSFTDEQEPVTDKDDFPAKDESGQDNSKSGTSQTNHVEGTIEAMTVAYENELVCIENDDGKYRIKTSSGKEKQFSFEASLSQCGLFYDSFSDGLFMFVAYEDSGLGEIYHLDKSYNLSESPVYTGKGHEKSDLYGTFFPDGTLYVNYFYNNLIDSKSWKNLVSIKIPVYASINDSIYAYPVDRIVLNEIDFNNNVIEQHRIPLNKYQKILIFRNQKYVYFMGTDNGSNLIVRFDGTDFDEVVNLNNCKNYIKAEYDAFCVTENCVWLYNKKAQTINKLCF